MDDMLNTVVCPEDLKKLPSAQLPKLCHEIRHKIIEVVSANGGHLSPNLGAVELTVALHRVFTVPNDAIVWDVGHQSYTHKILTERCNRIHTLRTKDGLSGYPNRSESAYDVFGTGHSSTSISAALGVAQSKRLHGRNDYVIAVIGDGALSGGLAYEGLNNAGKGTKNCYKNFIVILNDNKMSISKNVGSMSQYLNSLRTEPQYLRAKGNVEHALENFPIIGRPMYSVVKRSKKIVKNMVYNTTIFEDMGFAYYGPFDGHNIETLVHVFENAKHIHQPILIHVITEKGKGYCYAETRPDTFHGTPQFNIDTGEGTPSSGGSFSDAFGDFICAEAGRNKDICGITAAMETGTGLQHFAAQYPSRFFDVGIAEEHAVTFAGGLAAGGIVPIFAVYSSFIQRSYDQLIHDIAIQDLKIVLAIDRAGIVGEDGATHQGVFDVSMLSTIPQIEIYSPAFYDELALHFDYAVNRATHTVAVRYPRGKEGYKPSGFVANDMPYTVVGNPNATTVIVTYGRVFSAACLAMESLAKQGIDLCVIKLNRIKPISSQAVTAALLAKRVFFFEEGILSGGIAERFYYMLGMAGFEGKYHITAIDNQFVKHAAVAQSLSALKLDEAGITETILTEMVE